VTCHSGNRTERRYVEARYEMLPFPLLELPAPDFEIAADWSLPDVVGYLGTWSAVQRYRAARAEYPLPPVAGRLASLWPGGGPRRPRWPSYLRIGTIPPAPFRERALRD
jgi:hypothetical protein